MTKSSYIGLGSNLDNPRNHIYMAFMDIDNIIDTNVVSKSSLYETKPVGYIEQPNFVNAVVYIKTKLGPFELLKELQKIEVKHKRVRTIKNGPRTLDLDILLYDDIKIETDILTIPHPRMLERDFVLRPLSELTKIDL